jgi:tetratricopeptide (TPR) repeat protein
MATAESVESSAIGDYLVGQYAMDAGDVVQASDALERALAADPDDLDLRRQVFLLDVARGDLAGARDQARLLAEIDPGGDEPRLVLFIDALHEGRIADARRELDALPERSIGGLIAPVLQAWLEVAEGDPQGALGRLPDVEPDDPLFAVLTYHRAAIQALAGQTEAARTTLQPQAQDGQQIPVRMALLTARLIFEVDGQAAARRYLQGAAALHEEPAVFARAVEDISAGRAPMAVLASAGEGVADLLLAIVEALRQQGAEGRAIVYARLATWAAPEDGEAVLTLGGLMVVQDNADLAIETLAQLPEDSPWDWEAKLATVDATLAAGRQDDAEDLLERMAAARPERTDALVKLGDLARSGERYAEAERAYDRAIARVAALSATDWRLFYARGVARERLGRWPEAVTDFQRALQLAPDQPLVLNYLGYSWVDRGENLEKALGMLQKAVELRPRDGFIIDSLGWAYFKIGRLNEAVSWLDRAVEAEPGDPVINEHLGDAYWRAGRFREARFQWQRALTLSPDAELARLLRDKLANGLES